MKKTMVRILLCSVVATVIAVSWLRPLEDTAISQVDDGFKRAMVSFASARALNAVISFAQSFTIAGAPMGLGITVTPGQLLRPVNEVVAELAELMLVASVAFGVMKILIGIGSYWIVSLVLSVAALGWAWFQWRGQPVPILLARVLFVLLLVRFAVPLVTVGSNALFEKFMATDYLASQKAIDIASTDVSTLDPTKGDISDWRKKMEQIKGWPGQVIASASHFTEHIVKLIVMFLLQTLVVPLLLFWALYRAGSSMFDLPRRKA